MEANERGEGVGGGVSSPTGERFVKICESKWTFLAL